MDKMPCLPVKITDKRWADELQNGAVFMRALYSYGSWSAIERSKTGDTQMKSGVQGDVGEGIVRRVDLNTGDDFFNLFPDDLRAVMKDAAYIDQDRYQFFNVYCMYGLTYLLPERRFEQPDERLREFGDTAVIIYNPNEFVNRVVASLWKVYGDNVNLKVDEVHYYPPEYYGDLDEFCKRDSFAWQNELRIRIALLDEKDAIIDKDGQVRKRLLRSTEPILLNIGPIHDISIQISTEDLINLKIPGVIQPPSTI